MNWQEIFNTIRKKKWLFFWLTVFGVVLFFDLSLLQTPQYEAKSKVLVIQKQTQGQDIYTVSKSAQYLSRALKEGIYSDDFFQEVMSSSDKVSFNDFPENNKDRREKWQEGIEVIIFQDLGSMAIEVYHPNAKKAQAINQAITNTLAQNHQDYHGGGNNVSVKVLDYPSVSQKPVKPNPWLNSIFGGILAIVIGLWLAFRKKRY